MYVNVLAISFSKVCGGFWFIKWISMYLFCKLIYLMMKPLGGYTLLYMYIWIYDHNPIMGFLAWWYYVVLRAPMDDLLQRSHMGRYYIHSTEAVWELSSGRVVGVSTWCRPCWTYPGQHQCGHDVYYFWVFKL